MDTKVFQKPSPGPGRWLAALKNSGKGFRFAFKHEAAFREEFILVALLTPLAFFISSGWLHTCALIGGLLLLLIVEVLNSAIEAVIDRISLSYHPLSGAAKDMGSLAVLLCIIFNIMLWGASLLHWWKTLP